MPTRDPQQIADAVERMAGRGIAQAAQHLSRRIREVVSVVAPRRLVTASGRTRRMGFGALSRAKHPGQKYYVATTPATPGAPPRVVTGNLRAHLMTRKMSELHWRVGMFDVPYAAALETFMNHRYLMPTIRSELSNMRTIVGDTFTHELRT